MDQSKIIMSIHDETIYEGLKSGMFFRPLVDGHYSIDGGPSQYRRAGESLAITIHNKSVLRVSGESKCSHKNLQKKFLFSSYYQVCRDCGDEITNI